MIDLGFINVAGATVGQVFTLDWHNARIEPTLRQQAQEIADHISIYNESGVGFLVTMNQTSRSFTLPAGGWAPEIAVTIPGGIDLSLTLTVEYLLPLPAVSQVHADYFAPGEATSGASIVLGNSPINGSVTGLVASTLVNTGNSQGTVVINTSSSPGAGSILLNNDGSGTIKLLDNGVVLNVINFANGTNVTPMAVAFGSAADLVSTTFNGAGNFGNVSMQALVNSAGFTTVGLWAVIAHVRGQNVAVNTATNIINIASAPANGSYRLNGYFNKRNATASAISFKLTYTDPYDSTVHNVFLNGDINGTYTSFGGVTTVGSGTARIFTAEFDATVGTAITVAWTDPTGTANDFITATLELMTA